jgi:ribosomal protein L11 methyltransferase
LNTTEWFEFRCYTVLSLREAIINRLFEMGAEGVSEEELTGVGLSPVRAFFKTDFLQTVQREMGLYLNSLKELFPEAPSPTFDVRKVENENWAESYKQYYQPQRLTNRLYLQPKWNVDHEVPSDMLPVVMDPGQAFGTGLHSSTRLCLKMLQHAVDVYLSPHSISLLDVGTGSGILSIAAERFEIGKIIAIDNDPLAVEVAEENRVLNHCTNMKVAATPLSQLSETFDIVVANILMETHRELFPLYLKALKPRGQLILSGVLGSQRGDLFELVQSNGMRVEVSSLLQEWVAVLATNTSTI